MEYYNNRTWAIGLIVHCPFDESLDNCPLSDIRKLPVSERLKIVRKMSDEEINKAIGYHKNCYEKRNAK